MAGTAAISYDDMDAYEAEEKLPFFENAPADYIVEIQKVSDGISGDDDVQYFRVASKIVEARGTGANSPGSSVVYVSKKTPRAAKFQFFQRDLATFAAAALNEPITNVGGKEIKEMTDVTQPLKGIKVRVTVTPKAGSNFPRVAWKAL